MTERNPQYTTRISDDGASSDVPEKKGFDKPSVIITQTASEIEIRNAHWTWKGRIVRGKVNIWAGEKGRGKSAVTLDVVARITQGLCMPCDGYSDPDARRNVLIFSAEDDPGDTIVPRLVAAGADLRHVHIYRKMLKEGKPSHFTLQEHLNEFMALIKKHNVALAIFDPLSAYLGDINAFRDPEVRALFAPVVELLAKLNVAMLCIMHVNKAKDLPALMRILNSVAFINLARCIVGFVADPTVNTEDGFVMGLLPGGCNLVHPPDYPALAFKTVPYLVKSRVVDYVQVPSSTAVEGWRWEPIVEPLVEPAETMRIDWQGTSSVDVGAEFEAPGKKGPKPEQREKAMAFLNELLSEGPVWSVEVVMAAEVAGIASSTLTAAQVELHVERKKEPRVRNGRWFWRLPATGLWPWDVPNG